MGNLPVTGFNHICIVTADLDRTMRTYWEDYGIGPWKHWRFDDSNMDATIAGEPRSFAFRAAIVEFEDGARIELIQPLDDESLYAESLRRHDGADHFHHARFDVGDYDEATATAAAAGASVTLDANFKSGTEGVSFRATYLDTEPDLGFTLEIGQAPPGFTMADPEGVYPERG